MRLGKYSCTASSEREGSSLILLSGQPLPPAEGRRFSNLAPWRCQSTHVGWMEEHRSRSQGAEPEAGPGRRGAEAAVSPPAPPLGCMQPKGTVLCPTQCPVPRQCPIPKQCPVPVPTIRPKAWPWQCCHNPPEAPCPQGSGHWEETGTVAWLEGVTLPVPCFLTTR